MVTKIKYGQELVDTAKKIAYSAHAGQMREFGEDKGKPYIIHPLRIAMRFKDSSLKAAALLHDVIEDSDINHVVFLDNCIPLSVIAAVVRLTRNPKNSYLDYILRVKGNTIARQVKIEDIKDNLKSLPADRKSMRDKYILALHILEN